MPIKKPKAVKLPLPFQDQMQSADDHARRRGILMKRELEELGGFSWSEPGRGYSNRIGSFPRRMLFAFGAVAMGGMIVGGLLLAETTGFKLGPTIVYMESWSGDRTAEDAIVERDAAMADLRRRYIAQQDAEAKAAADAGNAEAEQAAREAIARAEALEQAAAEARAAAIARERAAARGASPL